MADGLRVLVCHPSPDVYGADLMLVRTVDAMRRARWRPLVTVPEDGPLMERLRATGAPVRITPAPVLRKSLLTPTGLAGTVLTAPAELLRLVRTVRSLRPDVMYVNTLTLPHWVAAGYAAGVPVVCHVRELESQARPVVARGLVAPLLLASRVVANSQATASFLATHHPRLAGRLDVVHNGFDFPPPAPPRPRGGPERVALVGRLSPRKGQDLAVRAVAQLALAGREVELELVGSVFPGYEWYEAELRSLATELGVDRLVQVTGYLDDVWPALARADAVVVPSRLEPFGSVAVEALACARPVVVTDVGGLPEIAAGEVAASVVAPDDVDALAAGISDALDLARTSPDAVAACSRSVRQRFGRPRYDRQVLDSLLAAADGTAPGSPGGRTSGG